MRYKPFFVLFSIFIVFTSLLIVYKSHKVLSATDNTQCNDGIDNDGDGLIDWQYDLGCYNPTDNTEGGILAGLDNGWTVFELAPGAKIIYVSSSQGNDSNDGLSPQTPVKSLSVGKNKMNDGGDWLLLKRGDVWNEQIGGVKKSGLSSSYPNVIATYGESTIRPKIQKLHNNSYTVNHMAILGIHFTLAQDYGVNWLGAGDNLLIEDNYFDTNGVNIQITNYGPVTNFKLRRNIIDSHYNTTNNAEGIFIKGANGILLEENFFDHNGWNESVSGAEATIFNHNVYAQVDTANVTARGNIFSRASATGMQARSGGVIDNNLFLYNPIGLTFGLVNGSPYPVPGGVSGTVSNNVFLGSRDISNSLPRGSGIELGNILSATVSNNIITKHSSSGGSGINIAATNGIGSNNTTIDNNIIYDWINPLLINFDTNDPDSQLSNLQIKNNDIQDFASSYIISYTNHLCKSSSDTIEGVNTLASDVSFDNNNYYTNKSSDTWFMSQWYVKNNNTCGKSNSVGIPSSDWTSGNINPPTITSDTISQSTYPDPNRDIATYQQFLGQSTSLTGFIAEIKKQSRFNWRDEYTASAVNEYIRAGFGTASELEQPIESCNEMWSCNSWETCTSNGTQTRSCNDLNNCGTTNNKPLESQSCNYTEIITDCTPNWSCNNWNTCSSSGTQTRSCNDLNNCGTNSGKPNDNQSCIYNNSDDTGNITTPEVETQTSEQGLRHGSYFKGRLVKVNYDSAVYHIGQDNKRRLFVNAPTFWSWHQGTWNDHPVEIVSQEEFDSFDIGGNITARPGVNLIQFPNSPKVYAVMPNSKLCYAVYGYGDNWRDRLIVVQTSFENDYTIDKSCIVDQNSLYPDGSVIKYKNSTEIWYIDNGMKHKVNSEIFRNNLFDSRAIISKVELDIDYPTGDDITNW